MKFFHNLYFLIFLPLFVSSCLKEECREVRSYIEYEPVYISQEDFDAPAVISVAREMENTSIVYAYGDFLLVNEFQKGIHIIDNSDPVHPEPVRFIEIIGNTHFTIRNHLLYANKLEDLVVLDVTDMRHPTEVNRLSDVFSNNRGRRIEGAGILAYYKQTDQTHTLPCTDYRYRSVMFSDGSRVYFDAAVTTGAFASEMYYANTSKAAQPAPTLGVGGSMARFTTIDDRLYLLSEYELTTMDLSDGVHPKETGRVPMTMFSETLYPFQDYLFIGTNSGMQIFSVAGSGLPEHLSTITHINSCDPVVTDGTYAYVTLRGGTQCGGFTNQLEIYNVSNVLQPSLVSQQSMLNPHGLVKIGDDLYVCEGRYGWKKINVKTPEEFKIEYFNRDHHAFDVIPTPQNTLLFIGEDGMYQYDIYGKNPKEISRLKMRST